MTSQNIVTILDEAGYQKEVEQETNKLVLLLIVVNDPAYSKEAADVCNKFEAIIDGYAAKRPDDLKVVKIPADKCAEGLLPPAINSVPTIITYSKGRPITPPIAGGISEADIDFIVNGSIQYAAEQDNPSPHKHDHSHGCGGHDHGGCGSHGSCGTGCGSGCGSHDEHDGGHSCGTDGHGCAGEKAGTKGGRGCDSGSCPSKKPDLKGPGKGM